MPRVGGAPFPSPAVSSEKRRWASASVRFCMRRTAAGIALPLPVSTDDIDQLQQVFRREIFIRQAARQNLLTQGGCRRRVVPAKHRIPPGNARERENGGSCPKESEGPALREECRSRRGSEPVTPAGRNRGVRRSSPSTWRRSPRCRA